MVKSKKFKTVPAGKDDKFISTYAEFAANEQRTEIRTGENKEFDNDVLLEILGFEKNEKGELKLASNEHEAEIADNGEVIRRKKGNKY